MKNLVFLPILILLVSCGGGSSNSTSISCNKNNSTHDLFEANSIQIKLYDYDTALPKENITVQLDHNGPCLTTDSGGIVNFNNLTADKHDIHIFGSPGYDWQSYYNVDTSQGSEISTTLFNNLSTFDFFDNDIKSYVNLSGSISNANSNNFINFIFMSDKRRRSSNIKINRNPFSYDIQYGFSEPENTTITSELWAFESEVDITTNDYTLIDAVYYPNLIVNSTALNGTATTRDIQFNTTKPVKSLLGQIDPISFPAGLSFENLSFTGIISKTNSVTRGISLLSTTQDILSTSPSYSAYITPALANNLILDVSATDKVLGGVSWGYTKYIATGAKNITVIPKLTTLPNLYQNQQGNTIAWSEANIPQQRQTISIREKITNRNLGYWWMSIAGGVNQVILPKLPNGIIPLLTSGEQYDVQIRGNIKYPDPLDANLDIDEYYINTGSWTR